MNVIKFPGRRLHQRHRRADKDHFVVEFERHQLLRKINEANKLVRWWKEGSVLAIEAQEYLLNHGWYDVNFTPDGRCTAKLNGTFMELGAFK